MAKTAVNALDAIRRHVYYHTTLVTTAGRTIHQPMAWSDSASDPHEFERGIR
jgi:hypothetical protein